MVRRKLRAAWTKSEVDGLRTLVHNLTDELDAATPQSNRIQLSRLLLAANAQLRAAEVRMAERDAAEAKAAAEAARRNASDINAFVADLSREREIRRG